MTAYGIKSGCIINKEISAFGGHMPPDASRGDIIMRKARKWIAPILALSMVLSDWGSSAAYALPEGGAAGQESVSENAIDTIDTEEAADADGSIGLPAIHIGQVGEGEPLPDPEDPDLLYDQPISFDLSDSVVLFTDYSLNGSAEAAGEGTIVWSILRGEKGMPEGSRNLTGEEDDWNGYETVSDSPYFTMTENDRQDDPFYQTVTLAAVSAENTAGGSPDAKDDLYYIRAAYYPGEGQEQAEDFYTAVTVPFVPVADAPQSESENRVTDAEEPEQEEQPEGEETDAGRTQEELTDSEETETESDRIQEEPSEAGENDADLPQDDEGAEEAADTGSVSENAAFEAADAALTADEAADVTAPDKEVIESELVRPTVTIDQTPVKDPLEPGDTVQLTAVVEPSGLPSGLVWKSSDTDVAAVDAQGMVTAVKEGQAQITAVCGDASASVRVEVLRADTGKMLDLSGKIWVAGFEVESDDLVYTGQKIVQDLRVYYNDIALQEKTDYTLSYKNNVNAATYDSAKAPSVTVNLKGQYSGSVTLYFTIRPRDINSIDPYPASVSAKEASPGYEQTLVYAKSLKLPNPELKLGKNKLKVNKDFVCDYTPDPSAAADGSLPMPENYKAGDSYEPGRSYRYTVNGIGNYTGSLQMRLVVVQDKGHNFDSASVKLDAGRYPYHGTPLSKEDVKIASVKLSNKLVEPDCYDYEVCSDDPAGAYVLVYPSQAGLNAGYRGSKKVSLKLTGDRSIKDAVLGTGWKDEILFSQKTLEEAGGFYQAQTDVLTYESEKLTEGKDYTVKYSNAKKTGKATVTFTGTGRYTGTLKKTYQIVPNLAPGNISIVWKNVSRAADGTLTVAYQKGGAVPEPVLKDQDNNVLKNKTDYTVKLSSNQTVGEKMSCVITGKGNYKGYSHTTELQVVCGDIGRGTLSVPDKAYSKKANAWKSKVTVKDINAKTLTAGKDYDKDVIYEYEGMESGQPPAAGSTVKVTVRGAGCYEGSVITGTYRIYQESISKWKVKIDAQEYTGSEITLDQSDIHIYLTSADMKNGKNELPGTCYEIVGYTNHIKAGSAKVTLRASGSYNGIFYGGTKTYTFKIEKKKYQFNHVTKVTLEQTSLTARLGDKKKSLTATLVAEDPDKALSNPLVIWSTSNSSVATVAAAAVGSPNAVVTFLKQGTVTITATSQDGNKKAQCKITIINIPRLVEADQVISLKVGETRQLTTEWEEPQPEKPVKLIWESSNPDKISVDKNGLVKMESPGAAVITLSAQGSSYIQQCTVIVDLGEEDVPPAEYEPGDKVYTYVQEPGTVDDAIEINKVLSEWEENPDLYSCVYLPAGVYHIGALPVNYNNGGIVPASNQKLIMSPGALLEVIPNDSPNDYRCIYVFGRTNVTIAGGQIIGDREEHMGTEGESGHGIEINGSYNVTVKDIEVSECWGDGIYLGAHSIEDKPSCDGVTLENCNLHHNRRNNLSITDANNVTIRNCDFSYAKGTDPQYGICIEYNYRPTEHVAIYDSRFKGNAKASMGIIKEAVDVRIENCTMDGNFYNMAGKNVVLKNTKISGEIVDAAGGIRRE